jgi:hypothetical protein
MRKIIRLGNMPFDVMLVIEHHSGVFYQNQVGGNVCAEEELEGVLAPVGLDAETVEVIANLEYLNGRKGISDEIADAIDRILGAVQARRATKADVVRVDRTRLQDSWEAWVYVVIDSPTSFPDDNLFDSRLGFGTARGVLTWPNSD